MSVRLRRLKADYDRMSALFRQDSRIRIIKTIGNPPEKYQVEFLVRSLQKNKQAQTVRAHNSFTAEIVLTASYPRMAPQCRMLTPVFHPNIAPHAVCIGDHWAAGESLARLVVRMAEMLAFQSYNVKSPLNGEAARWVEHNRHRLPLDETDFGALLTVGEADGRAGDAQVRCANCGAGGRADQMHVCANSHIACDDCLVECALCDRIACLACALGKCSLCGKTCCDKCIVRCGACERLVCRKHSAKCHLCKRAYCPDCLVRCADCRKLVCLEHMQKRASFAGKAEYVCRRCAVQTDQIGSPG